MHTCLTAKIISKWIFPFFLQVKIDWRIYTKNSEQPLIRDLIIEGLSLARTQKEEFASVLSSNNGDINALFKTLEEFTNK